MPMYAGVNGTMVEAPNWYTGIDGTARKITKFPVAVDGTQYTIYLTSNVAITVTIQNQVTDGCFTNESATAKWHTKILVNDKTICLVPDQLCTGTFTDTEDIKNGSTFQIDIRYDFQPTKVYINGSLVFTGGSKSDDDPKVMVLQANGDINVVITVTGSYIDGCQQVVEITGDAIATSIPPENES